MLEGRHASLNWHYRLSVSNPQPVFRLVSTIAAILRPHEGQLYVLLQTVEVMETSWINATLMWANKAQSIGDDNIFELNMTNGLPASQGKSFQVEAVTLQCRAFLRVSIVYAILKRCKANQSFFPPLAGKGTGMCILLFSNAIHAR